MKTIYVREYTFGMSTNLFESLADAQDFDCYPEDLIRIIEFVEVVPT